MYTGECNCCGRCCVYDSGQVRFACHNLLRFGRLGDAGATACAVHLTKWVGMPIWMVSEDGRFKYPSRCLSSYPRGKDAVPPECSYVFVPDKEIQEQPGWYMGYTPTLARNPTEV